MPNLYRGVVFSGRFFNRVDICNYLGMCSFDLFK